MKDIFILFALYGPFQTGLIEYSMNIFSKLDL